MILAILQLRHLRRELQFNYQWQRGVRSLRYTPSEDEHLRETRSRLNNQLGIFTRPDGEIGLAEIERLDTGDPEHTIRADLSLVLGRFENMCIAMANDLVDEEICYQLSRGGLIRYHRFFRQYIDDVRKSHSNPKLYEFLEHYALIWDQKDDHVLTRSLLTR